MHHIPGGSNASHPGKPITSNATYGSHAYPLTGSEPAVAAAAAAAALSALEGRPRFLPCVKTAVTLDLYISYLMVSGSHSYR